MMPSWHSDPFNRYSGNVRWRRRPQNERVERDGQKFRERAEKLLHVFDVWEEDVKLVLAECNKRYEEAKYTHNIEDELRKLIRLKDILDGFDCQMRECGLHIKPKGNYLKKRWY